jgi:hypothetical protein
MWNQKKTELSIMPVAWEILTWRCILKKKRDILCALTVWLKERFLIDSTITLIVQGEVKVDLTNFDVKLRKKPLCTLLLKNNYSIPAKTSFKSFSYFLTSKVRCGAWPKYPPPHSARFCSFSDHSRAEKVPMSFGWQSGAAPVRRIQTSFRF